MDTDNVHEAAVSKRNFPRRSKAMKKVMKKVSIVIYLEWLMVEGNIMLNLFQLIQLAIYI